VTTRPSGLTPAQGIRADAAGNLALFVLMSLIWGGTWAAVKVGVTAVPPIFFAGLRYALVGVLLAVLVRDFTAPFERSFAGRTLLTGTLVNVGTYSLLFWGMQFVASGVSGLINLSLIPVGLFGFSVLLGDEKPSWRYALALALGAAGLVVLFSNKAALAGSRMELWGALAIIAGTFCYCLGTVLSRPLTAVFTPLQLTAAQAVVGAPGLILLAAVLEPLSLETLHALVSPAPLAGLLYLAIAGTLAAYTIYLRLVRDWGAPRAGLYAFISPIVALTLGSVLFEERVGWREAAGALIMLTATGLALGMGVRTPRDRRRLTHRGKSSVCRPSSADTSPGRPLPAPSEDPRPATGGAHHGRR
jgi:drug/metabolite transporter (DMT)-like permease